MFFSSLLHVYHSKTKQNRSPDRYYRNILIPIVTITLSCSHRDSDGKNTPTAGEARVYIMGTSTIILIISHDIMYCTTRARSVGSVKDSCASDSILLFYFPMRIPRAYIIYIYSLSHCWSPLWIFSNIRNKL